ncbi:thioredoxin [Trichuris suis]|nr:thioredoxin [Trichuris suis]
MKTKQSGTLAFMSSKSFAYRFSSYFASFLLLNLLVDGKVIELTNANFDKIIGELLLYKDSSRKKALFEQNVGKDVWEKTRIVAVFHALFYVFLQIGCSADVALVNFHAEWCRFSKMLVPVFSDASNVFPEPNIVFGSVDCDRETTLASKFHITKYPTLKLFRNGEMAKREYRGSRSVDAFTNFIRSQLVETIRHSNTEEELNRTLNTKRSSIILYAPSNTEPLRTNYRNIASSLRDECEFHAFIRQVSLFFSCFYAIVSRDYCSVFSSFLSRLGVWNVYSKPQNELKLVFTGGTESPNERIVYPDNLLNNVALKHWIHEKCIPLVREITFQNAEELTEEGRPFLILFYARDKRDIVKTYVNEVAKQLQDLKSSVNFLYADGHTFAHPLHHLGKSEKDLPLLAIDSFRHMYLFPSINDLTVPGKLRQFILDLQSGKLHRDFHNVPPSVETTPAPQSVSETAEAPVRSGPLTPAADSVFVKLKPANTRYTVLRDEL